MPVIFMKCPECKETHPVYIPPRATLPGPCGARPKTAEDYTTCPVCHTMMEVDHAKVCSV